MPKEFTDCITNGGRVITKIINKSQYIRICYPKGGGSPVHGEVKVKKGK